MRQQAVEELAYQQATPQAITTHAPLDVLDDALESVIHNAGETPVDVSLHLLVRTPEQLDAAN
jgi:hypothetical protein